MQTGSVTWYECYSPGVQNGGRRKWGQMTRKRKKFNISLSNDDIHLQH